MTVTIRRASAADAPVLGAMHSAVWAELYPKALPADVISQLNPGYMEHLWTKFVSRGDDYVQWVAERDGHIIGFVGTGPARDNDVVDQTELYFLYVIPEARGTGAGTQLLAAADADYLWVWEEFKRTRTFYVGQGFTPEIVRAVRGMGPRSRVGHLFGSSYQTELKMIRTSRG
jgi:GNAT superfamily N-acetyltransferase